MQNPLFCFVFFVFLCCDDERLNHILRLRTADLQPLELQIKTLYKSTVAAAPSDAAAELLMVLVLLSLYAGFHSARSHVMSSEDLLKSMTCT